MYNIRDKNNKLIRPSKVAFKGCYRVIENNNNDNNDSDDDNNDDDVDDFYRSKLLINPTFAELLLEAEKIIIKKEDFNKVILDDFIIHRELYGCGYHTIRLCLGS